MRSASSAGTELPSMASARARASPTVCGRNQVPPRSGISEMRTKAWSKRAERAASTISQASARLAPPPAATPFTAATIGLGRARMARIIGLKRRSMAAPRSGWPAASGSPGPPPARSAPAQKPRPMPVSRTARISLSSRARPSSWFIASIRPGLMALSRCGRFSMRVRTPPSRAAMTGVLSMAPETGTGGPLAATLPAPSGRVASRHALAYLGTRCPRS